MLTFGYAKRFRFLIINNALSGGFDIKSRKGNNNRREHTFSACTIGIDAATEGYLKKDMAAHIW